MENNLVETVNRVTARVRRAFLYPPLRETECSEMNPSFVGGLVERKVLVNPSAVSKLMQDLRVDQETIVAAVVARSLNRFLRIPESFGQALRLYAAMREVVLEAQIARRFLETYFALWCEIDLYYNRSKGRELVDLYAASLPRDPKEQEKLCAYYRVMVAVLQKTWRIDLGVRKLEGWEHVARSLAQIDYLQSSDRVRDVQKFGKLLSRCFTIIQKQTGKDPEQQEEAPTHWPLENTIDSFVSLQDIREGIAEFLDEFPDKAQAMALLAEFSALNPLVQQMIGRVGLLEQSRWYWYEQLAKPYQISVMKKPSVETGRVYAVSLTRWDPEDGIQNLAILATFGPIGLPGLTKTWLYAGPESQLCDQQVPDLIIAIDTSGSMTNPSADKSYAVLGAFVAANSYLDYGSRVAVVNFGDEEIVLDFTTDRTSVYKHLAAFQCGSTEILRQETIEGLLKKSRRQVDILVITDLGQGTFETAFAKLAKQAETRRVFFFLINVGTQEEEQARSKLPETIEFHRVGNDEDLIKIVLGSVQRSFETQREMKGAQNDAGN